VPQHEGEDEVSLGQRALLARQVIGKQLNVLYLIDGRAARSGDLSRARQRLRRWQDNTARLLTNSVSAEIGAEFIAQWTDIARVTNRDTMFQLRQVYQTYLFQLLEELKYSPDNVLSP
jgi:hypothetical protein